MCIHLTSSFLSYFKINSIQLQNKIYSSHLFRKFGKDSFISQYFFKVLYHLELRFLRILLSTPHDSQVCRAVRLRIKVPEFES